MTEIFIFGNPLVDQDSLPLRIIPKLTERFHGITFIELDPTEDMEKMGRNPIIIDTAFGIEKVKVLTDIDKIEDSPKFSMHDFDLGMNLKIMKKLGKIDSVTIICVPPTLSIGEAVDQVSDAIRSLF